MTDDREVREKADGHDPSQENPPPAAPGAGEGEDPAPAAPQDVDGESPASAVPRGGEGEDSASGTPRGGEGPVPAAPRGIDGESRVVAERSGADTSFPERPLLADPDDARAPEGADEKSGEGVPEPKVGPTS
ncbi:hypothetical protein [Streptosporangium roseum]|uniref:Uncharacterized protein n=1 Tax=Streptosporangium roseum (strain ATCC 12428 / DSM 43021 / JCM 3005 / KCTC 9067 / NCIMB 10171 / NRRL 2505 / NI 9100) TaxID=479432 RepID=D2BEV6_STRRD|nr:hypothetical protein [Streptosporangium roseum]ACZ86317.1 conserved hypothetical protein [Streptosporangium roseum DSM 43021]